MSVCAVQCGIMTCPLTNHCLTLRANLNWSTLFLFSSSFFFKTTSDEFDSGVVHQEISNDDAVLPLWEGKVVAKVERVEQ